MTQTALFKDRRILLLIGGGIAAYKSLDLIRRIREKGGSVRTIMTAAAHQFVTPLSVSSLAGESVFSDLFDLTREAEMGHIELSRSADLLVVAPATADLLAKMAQGRADDLASTTLLATTAPVLVAPAMNVRMWQHHATQRNAEQLRQDGIFFVGPDNGEMACGEFGPGRMAEPPDILRAIEARFTVPDLPLTGIRGLVTSGPTHEPIDPARYIANRSSGKQGHAIAGALARLGADIHLVSGPVTEPDPADVHVTRVETAREMLEACNKVFPVDFAVCAAAVADWRVEGIADQKISKKQGSTPQFSLIENPDILATLSRQNRNRPRLMIGFAAETENILEHARAKRIRKGCDWIIANDISPSTGIMGGNDNTVHFIDGNTVESWSKMPKHAIAEKLAARIARHLAGTKND